MSFATGCYLLSMLLSALTLAGVRASDIVRALGVCP